MRTIPESARKSKWDVNLWNGNLTGSREYSRRQRIKIISYCGTGADLLGEKDLLFFGGFMCYGWASTEKDQIFLRCPDRLVCLAYVLMEYVQF